MDVDLDRWHFDSDPETLESVAPGDGFVPPPPAPNPPERLPPADPRSDLRALTWTLLVSVAALSALKLALFAVGGALAAAALGAVFVAAHGLLIAGGGTWFWQERYR